MILTSRETDIRDELIQWGHWSRCTGLNLTMANKSNLAPQITDDRALAIDKVVAILSLRDKAACEILKFTYIQCLTIREISKRKNINKDKVSTLLKVAIGSVEVGLSVQAANDDKYNVKK